MFKAISVKLSCKELVFAASFLISLLVGGCAQQKVCVLQTNMGTMEFKFFAEAAPQTCTNFQDLVEQGFYDGKDFYRVVQGHVIQAGGGGINVPAEFNQNKHIVGAVGLARSNDPDSGNSSFYICLAPRPHLDGQYTVFGQLIEGYDVLEKIGNTEVIEQFRGNVAFHRPKEPVLIEKAALELRRVK